ncbi:Rab5-interacting protein-domain-containing protein [Durotheca rogersii]|uniref:Rab5-interacting protein-domain-containing protein n=1 Tax=Durotheca rogersii TaxID=419775 RepID=UPI00221FF88F|nr:Rab5-interacting protein-domain-containing protein [Durotheca rogersii]KAI5861729.1 Rab5-interacting protein-domain-containing protein [Durotheca rogersii]
MPSERELQISPIVPESVMHNTKAIAPHHAASHRAVSPSHDNPLIRRCVTSTLPANTILPLAQALSNLQTLTASIFGAAAGILGLESYAGFLFYLALTAVTTLLFYAIRVAPESLAAGHAPLDTSRYFRSRYEFWAGGLFSGLAGYVLTWTLFYGLVRA